jgi:alpha,alpha-trehalase
MTARLRTLSRAAGALVALWLLSGGPGFCAPPAAGLVGLEMDAAGTWWFTSPTGKQFLSIGANHVEPVYWQSPSNRAFVLELYGPELISADGHLNDGSPAAGKWAQRVATNFHRWGFNTLGFHNPLSRSLQAAGDAYYVVALDLPVPWGWNMPRSALVRGFQRAPLDVFGDDFAASVRSNALARVKPYASDPRVLGYAYTDGPPWTVDDDTASNAYRSLTEAEKTIHPWVLALMSLPAEAQGKRAWLALMKARYASPGAAGATYGKKCAAWNELASTTVWTGIADAPRAGQDSQAFLLQIIRQWYEVRHQAVREHDRHHLILGDKLNLNRDARHPELLIQSLHAMGDYVDLINIQFYAPFDKQRDALALIYRESQKPILNGDTACNPQWQDHPATNQDYFGKLGETYAGEVAKLFSLPYFIGWHHCGYMRGLRPPYLAALKRGDRREIESYERGRRTYREGFITDHEVPLEALVRPLSAAIADCDRIHRHAPADSAAPAGAPEKYPGLERVLAHIRAAFPQTIKEQKEDQGDILGLPCPYTSPCAKEGFQQLFNWDTYFINLGLLRIGMQAQAKNNVDDLLFLTDKFGLVPSASRRSMANRSQTPFLALMVRDLFAATGDRAWLERAYPILVKEHSFWMTQRLSPLGLNRPGNSATTNYLLRFYSYLERERFKGLTLARESEKLAFSSQALSEAELWDFTPRFDRRAAEFCPVDLNANLYRCEIILADLSEILKNGEESAWRGKAAKRKHLIQQYLWNDQVGCYTDYDFVRHRKGDLVSCAALFPLAAGIATPEQAAAVVKKLRAVLEYDHGLATCEQRAWPFSYQWDYPNGWPPLQCLAIQALDRYGFKEDARRIAGKYVRTVIRNYETTGDLWEKYNVVTGTTEVVDEYKMPRMVGWTAGVFVYAADYLGCLEAPK